MLIQNFDTSKVIMSSVIQLPHVMQLVSFYTPLKHQKHKFSVSWGIERYQWHEMSNFSNTLELISSKSKFTQLTF